MLDGDIVLALGAAWRECAVLSELLDASKATLGMQVVAHRVSNMTALNYPQQG